MKYLIILMVAIVSSSCDIFDLKNFDEEPVFVNFHVFSQENDSYREIRIYGKELKNGVLMPFDSVIYNAINRNGTEETFIKGHGYGLSFFADSLLKIQSGSFEAVAVRKDFSLVRKNFGQITAGQAHANFKITLTSAGIVVEDI